MALSDLITGQFRRPQQPQRPYLPTIVRDAEPTRPPIAQPPPQRTPMPPPQRENYTRRMTTPLPPGYLAPDEPRQQAQNQPQWDYYGMRNGPFRPQPRTTPDPSPAEQARQRAYEWEEQADRVVPPGMGFGRIVQKWENLSPAVNWNRYPVNYVTPEDMPVTGATGAYYPGSREIDIVNPDPGVLLHEYAHAYDFDRNADPYPDVSSDPQFFGNWLGVSKLPWLFAEQHPTYDSEWYRNMANAVVRGDPWGDYPTNPSELYAELAPRYAQSPYNVPAQLRPYIAGMFDYRPMPPSPYPYPRPAPTPTRPHYQDYWNDVRAPVRWDEPLG